MTNDLTNSNAALQQLTNEERDILVDVGFDSANARAATSIVVDHAVKIATSADQGVEILPLAEALKTYDFVQELMFGLVDPDENEHISLVAEHMEDPLGHFIWVKPGAKVQLPVQSFTLLELPQGRQFTHDITLIDEGAEVEIISGSAVPSSVHRGRHVSIGETYQRAGSKCKSTSIESWGEAMEIYSYGYSKMDAGAQSTSLSIMLSPIKKHVSVSNCVMDEDANSISQSIVFAPKGTERVIGTTTILNGRGAKSEDVSRMVSAGGTIKNNALLVGEAAETNGFLGCDGLKLTNDGEILAVPALKAKAEGAMLSHEASVGMVDGEKLNYLMAAGIDEDAARDLIIQGFLSLKDENLPANVRAKVSNTIAQAKSGGM